MLRHWPMMQPGQSGRGVGVKVGPGVMVGGTRRDQLRIIVELEDVLPPVVLAERVRIGMARGETPSALGICPYHHL